MRMNGPLLIAQCKTPRDQLEVSSLDLAECTNPVLVKNVNGHLQCYTSIYPGGSWRETCDDPSLDGSVVSARCKGGPRHYWTETSIDVRTCTSNPVTLANSNGRLVCGK